MNITIRNYRTGEALRTWSHPGSKRDAEAEAHKYAVGRPSKVIEHDDAFNVYVVPKD